MSLDSYDQQQLVDAIMARLLGEGVLRQYSSNGPPYDANFEDGQTQRERKRISIIIDEVCKATSGPDDVIVLPDASWASVSAAMTGRLRYNAVDDVVQVSTNGSAYRPLSGKSDSDKDREDRSANTLLAIVLGNVPLESVSLELLERAVELVGIAAVNKAKKEKDAT